jgi:hypothetical protein
MSEERKYRAVSIYVSLLCGLIVLLVGIYLTITQKILYGLTLPGARSGTAGGAFKPVALPGIGVLCVGIVLSALPASYIITNSGKKNSES